MLNAKNPKQIMYCSWLNMANMVHQGPPMKSNQVILLTFKSRLHFKASWQTTRWSSFVCLWSAHSAKERGATYHPAQAGRTQLPASHWILNLKQWTENGKWERRSSLIYSSLTELIPYRPFPFTWCRPWTRPRRPTTPSTPSLSSSTSSGTRMFRLGWMEGRGDFTFSNFPLFLNFVLVHLTLYFI